MKRPMVRWAVAMLAALLTVLALPFPATAAPVDAPTGLSPDGADSNGNPQLTWDHLDSAVKYRVQISADPAFGATLVSEVTYNTAYVPSIELPTGELFWRVAGVDSSGTGPNSAVASFTKSLAAPLPTAPADGAALVYPSEPPTLAWTPSVTSKSYRVEVDDAADFIGANAYVTRNSTFTIPVLLPISDTFFWRVRGSSNTSGTGVVTDWSESRTLSIAWPALPQPVSPIGGANITDLELVWSPVPGAESYEVQVNLTEDFSVPDSFATITYATRTSPNATLLNDDYYWRVRAIDQAGNSGNWTAPAQFTRQWLSTPTLLSPAPGATTSGNLRFEWTPVDHASSYRLEVSSDSNFTAITACTTSETRMQAGPGTQCGIPGGGAAPFYWRVRALDERPTGTAVLGLYSAIRSHGGHTAVTRAPGIFDANSPVTQLLPADCPADAACRVSANPTFTWTAAPGATRYKLYIYRDVNFTNRVKELDLAAPITELTLNEELPDNNAGQAYYWHIRPCAVLCGPDPLGTAAPSMAFQKESTKVALVTPAEGATVSNQPKFTWEDYLETTLADDPDPAPGTTDLEAKTYQIQVSTGNSFAAIIDDKVLDNPFYTPYSTTYPEGPLYWRVRAIDGDGNNLAWSDIRSAQKVSASPTPTAPTDGATSPGVPTFRWQPLASSANYVLEIYKDDGGTPWAPGNRVLSVTTPHTEHTPVAGLPTGDYLWRLRRDDATGKDGAWTTSLRHFRVTASPVTLVLPTAGALLTGNDSLFSWEGVDGASSYRFEVSATAAPFTAIGAQAKTTVMTSFAPVALFPEGLSYWRVQAFNADGDVLGVSTPRSVQKDSVGPAVTSKSPTAAASLTGPFEVTFSEAVTGVSNTSFTLTPQGSGTPVAATVTAPTTTTAKLQPTAPLVPGQTYTVRLSAAIKDLNGNSLVPVTWAVRTLLAIENTSSSITDKWDRDATSAASGGGYSESRIYKSSMRFAFLGDTAQVYGRKGVSGGIASIYVDGVKQAGTFSFYSSTTKDKQLVFSKTGMGGGNHTLELRVTNTKSAGSTGYYVRVDYVKAGAITLEDDSSAVTTSFGTGDTSLASGGSYDRFDHVSDSGLSAKAVMSFVGTGVDWYGVRGATGGKAAVYIDGVKKAEVDLYGSSTSYKVKLFGSAVLPAGAHTIEIRAIGTKSAAATGTVVFLDYLKVR